MSKTFPTVGLIADGSTAWTYAAPARSLGIELVYLDTQEEVQESAQKCDVVSIVDQSVSLSIAKKLEADGVTVRPSFSAMSAASEALNSAVVQPTQICVMVARSPHGQATTWAPTEIHRSNNNWTMSISPAPQLTGAMHEKAQKLALGFSAQLGAVGVLAVEMSVKDEDISVVNVRMHPHDSGNWTVDGSITGQYEQHLRAILDLPLGDPAMSAPYVVTGNFYCGDKPNMYRPYLHLMARTPALKFHQYKNSGVPGDLMGHITLAGDDLPTIIQEIDHALQYMQGEIDE